MNYTVRRLTGDDVTAYRSIRLEGLEAEPAAFGSTLEEDAAIDHEALRSRLARNFTFGVFAASELSGTATYYVETGKKTAHRGHLVGVYVRPGHRGTGAAKLLLQELIASARQNVQFLYLQVTQTNTAALRLYERMGFVVYGKDPGGLMVDGVMHQDYLMLLPLQARAAESDE